MMKTKEITLYETIYQYLLDLIIENGVTLNKNFFRTDGEHNLYRGFENIFSKFCSLSHQYCKRHFTENLRVSLQEKGKIG